jgi:hypothetical protein
MQTEGYNDRHTVTIANISIGLSFFSKVADKLADLLA